MGTAPVVLAGDAVNRQHQQLQLNTSPELPRASRFDRLLEVRTPALQTESRWSSNMELTYQPHLQAL
jgi:hypothetical protein